MLTLLGPNVLDTSINVKKLSLLLIFIFLSIETLTKKLKKELN